MSGIRLQVQGDSYELRVQSLTTNATRHITSFFLVSSKELHGQSKPCMTYDLLWPPASPVVVAMQYIGSLIIGRCPHMWQLWWLTGCNNWLDFQSQYPENAKLARTAFYATASSIHRRNGVVGDSRLMQAVSLADPRQSMVGRGNLAIELGSRRKKCCNGSLLAAVMDEGVVEPADFFRP